jgi:hypothetical protein
MKTLQHIQALACAALMAGAVSAQANAPVYVTFDITWGSGPLDGTTSSGSFCYDSMVLTGVGEEVIGSNTGLLTLDLDIAGNMFSIEDDIEFGMPSQLGPNFPLLFFNDGAFAGLDYLVLSGSQSVFLNRLSAEYDGGQGLSMGRITVVSSVAKSVPDAGATVSLLAFGLGAITLARRKLKS